MRELSIARLAMFSLCMVMFITVFLPGFMGFKAVGDIDKAGSGDEILCINNGDFPLLISVMVRFISLGRFFICPRSMMSELSLSFGA